MLKFRIPADEAKRYAVAAGAGLVLATAFPKISMAGFAWVAPGVMLMTGLGAGGGAVFRVGYVGGLAFYLGALSWLLKIPVAFTPIGGWLVLAGYLAVYPAVWMWLCWRIYPARLSDLDKAADRKNGEHEKGVSSPRSDGGEGESSARGIAAAHRGSGALLRRLPSFPDLLDWFCSTPWPQRVVWGFRCAALWVALEMIVGRLFTGFPWLYLGASQYRMLPVIQVASVTGVYGVSFLAVWFSVALASGLLMLLRPPQTASESGERGEGAASRAVSERQASAHQARQRAQREIVVPLIVAAAVTAAGWRAISRPMPPQHTVKIALIQPSIPQTWVWDPKEGSNRFQQLLQLSSDALTNHPDLLVWPEAAVPNVFKFGNQFSEDIYGPVVDLIHTNKIWLVLGGDEVEVRPRSTGRIETNWFNSCYLMNPVGDVVATYRKRRLVVFGEYIPFGRDFSFIENITGLGSFTPGERPEFFSIPSLHIKAGVSICFEDVFPHLIRTAVDDDTDFLLNLTNNGWFGESAAQWQHAADAVFRAVENGLPLVRCANNGLTCWVDRRGNMNATSFPNTDNIYGVGFKIVEVPILDGQKREPTFYHQHGDWFGWGCVALGAVAVLTRFGSRLRRPV